jgi:uncharacterized membrane protein
VFILFSCLSRETGAFHACRDRREFGEAAREILDRRYASGEITREHYEEMKRVPSRLTDCPFGAYTG